MPARFGFGKKEKLKSRKAIEALFLQGKSISHFPLRIMYLLSPVQDEANAFALAGVSASKKHFRRAVHRNRIKRLLREAYRLQKASLSETLRSKKLQAHIFFLFMDKSLPDFGAITTAMGKCLSSLEKAAHKHESRA